jgi:hypothetical protein
LPDPLIDEIEDGDRQQATTASPRNEPGSLSRRMALATGLGAQFGLSRRDGPRNQRAILIRIRMSGLAAKALRSASWR